jgi:hypothetical protein
MRPRLATAATTVVALAAALTVLSCGSKPPEVAAVEWRIESRPLLKAPAAAGSAASGGSYESLSVFGSIKDEDGLDNIEELWIVNDAEALAWKLTNAEWTKAAEGGDNWIGGSALAQPDLSPLPRGEYKLIAIDAAGQRAELAFAVSGAFPARTAPSASLVKGKLAVRSDWPETLVLAFDAADALLASVPAGKEGASLAEILGQAFADRAATVCAYGYEPALKMGAFSARIKAR